IVHRRTLTLAGVFILAALVSALLNEAMLSIAGLVGWEQQAFVGSIIVPLACTALLAITMSVRTWNVPAIFVSLVCAFSATLPFLADDVQELRARTLAQASERRFYPLKAFEADIQYDEDMRMFVSASINQRDQQLYSRGSSSSRWMFNLYFRTDARPEQFEYSEDPTDVLTNEFTYAFLDRRDWAGFEPELRIAIESVYLVSTDNTEGIWFLVNRGAL
ncbi:MAG: hypothetical protein V3T14_11720, partial [Myxococcota bacterium]